MRTARARRWPVLAAIAIACGALPAVAPTTAAAKPLFRVVAPRDDQLMHGRTLRVKLRLARDVRLRSAKLNNVPVKRFFRSHRGGRLQVAVLDRRRLGRALPRGRNFLRFVVRRGARGRRGFETVALTRVVSDRSIVSRFRARYRPGKGLRVLVVPATLSARIRVQLNGHNVSRLFRGGTPLKRAVWIGASDGLRHGRNRLRVAVFSHHGRFTALRRTIRVGPGRTIAGAGRDRRVATISTVRLDGRASKRARGRRGHRLRAKLRYRWRVTRRPRGSKVRLRRRESARPALQTDVPGKYTVSVETSQGKERSFPAVDTVEIKAGAQPEAPIETFAKAGERSGIAVEQTRGCLGAKAAATPPCFYPNKGAAGDLQVVVLDRDTLEPQSNVSYPTDELAPFAAAMAKLAPESTAECPAYDSSKLVILALREGSIADTANFEIGTANFRTAKCKPGGGLAWPTSGPLSVIAVPGMLAGKAWINVGEAIAGPDGTRGVPGALEGLLVQTSDNPIQAASTRSFSFPGELGFDTRANGGEIEIGGHSLPLPSSEEASLAVYRFDAVNPGDEFELAATIAPEPGFGDRGLDWLALRGALESAYSPGAGIAVVSTGGRLSGFEAEPQAQIFGEVLTGIERLGANPDSFVRAVNENGAYSLVATVDSDFHATAADSSSAVASGVESAAPLPVVNGRLTGTLLRGADGVLYPAQSDPSGIAQPLGLRAVLDAGQTEWQLTPPPETTTATCQQTAFAYLASHAFGSLGASAPLEALWQEGATASACEGAPREAGSDDRRADTLAGDACAASDPVLPGAIGGRVRNAALALRDSYRSTSTTFSADVVDDFVLPTGAPFTDADLTCAKNQLIDELAAREQVEAYMTALQAPFAEGQGESAVRLGQVAENVKTGALASIAGQLREPKSNTTGFWVGMAFHIFSGLAKTVAVFAAPESSLLLASQFAVAAGEGGSAIFSLSQGPAANPASAANEYILLASQLDQQAEEIEVQIENALTAERNGLQVAEDAILSDPGRMATVNAHAKTDWQVSQAAQERARQAYAYRVVQLAYESFLPQVYEPVRVSYHQALHDGSQNEFLWWNDGAWREILNFGVLAGNSGYVPPVETHASEVDCSWGPFGGESIRHPFWESWPGEPFGLGEGNEYHPQLSVATQGATPEYLIWALIGKGSLSKFEPSPAGRASLEEAFAQPVAADGSTDPEAGAIYAPDFWFDNFQFDTRAYCQAPNEDPRPMHQSSVDGLYETIEDGDAWPTPTTLVP